MFVVPNDLHVVCGTMLDGTIHVYIYISKDSSHSTKLLVCLISPDEHTRSRASNYPTYQNCVHRVEFVELLVEDRGSIWQQLDSSPVGGSERDGHRTRYVSDTIRRRLVRATLSLLLLWLRGFTGASPLPSRLVKIFGSTLGTVSRLNRAVECRLAASADRR